MDDYVDDSRDQPIKMQDTNLLEPCYWWNRDHPPELVIGNLAAPLRTRRQMFDEFLHLFLN